MWEHIYINCSRYEDLLQSLMFPHFLIKARQLSENVIIKLRWALNVQFWSVIFRHFIQSDCNGVKVIIDGIFFYSEDQTILSLVLRLSKSGTQDLISRRCQFVLDQNHMAKFVFLVKVEVFKSFNMISLLVITDWCVIVNNAVPD